MARHGDSEGHRDAVNTRWNDPTGVQRDWQAEACGQWMKAYYARQTPEQRAAKAASHRRGAIAMWWRRLWTPYLLDRKRIADGAAMEPEREATLRKADSNLLKRVEEVSIKRIIKQAAFENQDKVYDAWLDGIMARPPYSFPYIALAAAYLDGKPGPAVEERKELPDLQNLTDEELADVARGIAERLQEDARVARANVAEQAKRHGLPVIDVQPEPSKKEHGE